MLQRFIICLHNVHLDRKPDTIYCVRFCGTTQRGGYIRNRSFASPCDVGNRVVRYFPNNNPLNLITMKRIFIFIFLISLLFVSCEKFYDSPYDSVFDQDKETTLHLLSLPSDTVRISIDGDMLYVFSLEPERVIIKTRVPGQNSVTVDFLYFFIVHFLFFFFCVIFFLSISK